MQLLLAGSSIASGTSITGIYSSLNVHDESGDILGIEVTISESYSGKYFVTFQASEGQPRIPVVSEANVNRNEITFHVNEKNGYQGLFRGEISSGQLKGHFEQG
ncbi:hypothetical protein [Photobacterium galatheae]|nr:hypothetical protein [Photobacterium galatheae]MCM0148313.1 hypothetical protein [Photobacterium galatheae]